MDTILSLIARALGGSVAIYILMEIIELLIIIWILYAIIKNAVKKVIFESRNELNYTIRKALMDSKADIESGIKYVPDYAIPEYLKDDRIREVENRRQKAQEKAEWEYGKRIVKEKEQEQESKKNLI